MTEYIALGSGYISLFKLCWASIRKKQSTKEPRYNVRHSMNEALDVTNDILRPSNCDMWGNERRYNETSLYM